jgi:uncharacterized protein YegP (UPF0339 family)
MFFERDVVKKGRLKGQFTWRLKSRNGKILAAGESYTRKSARDKAIKLVQLSFDAPVRNVA